MPTILSFGRMSHLIIPLYGSEKFAIYIPQFGIRIVHKKLVVSQIFCTFIGDLQQVTNIFDMTTDYKFR